jgi:acylphosphatase
VWYEGRVQGVGFRYTALRIAGRFQVTGFVKNLPDGRVWLVIEGAVDEIERFLAAVAAELERHITAARQCVCRASGEFSSFEISF